MKIVVAVEGNTNIMIREMVFLTQNKELIKLDLSQMSDVRSTPRKIYSTYKKILMNGRPAQGYGYLLDKTELISISIDKNLIFNNIKLSDLHIYDKRNKCEVFIIPKPFNQIIIDLV